MYGRLGRGVFVFDEDTHTLLLKSELFDLRVGYANPILRLRESQRAVQILSYQCQRNKKTTELFGLGCPFIWRRKRDSNPRAFWANGFQELEILSQKHIKVSLNLPDFPEKKPFLRPFPDIPWKFARKVRENIKKH